MSFDGPDTFDNAKSALKVKGSVIVSGACSAGYERPDGEKGDIGGLTKVFGVSTDWGLRWVN